MNASISYSFSPLCNAASIVTVDVAGVGLNDSSLVDSFVFIRGDSLEMAWATEPASNENESDTSERVDCVASISSLLSLSVGDDWLSGALLDVSVAFRLCPSIQLVCMDGLVGNVSATKDEKGAVFGFFIADIVCVKVFSSCAVIQEVLKSEC